MALSNSAASDARLIRAQMLLHLGACLMEWDRVLSLEPWAHPSVAQLRNYSAQVLPEFAAAGFSDIARALAELVRRVDSQGETGDPRQPLSLLRELTERARRLVSSQGCAVECAASQYQSPTIREANASVGAAGTSSGASRGTATSCRAPFAKSLLGLRAFVESKTPSRSVRDFLGGIVRQRGTARHQETKSGARAIAQRSRRTQRMSLALLGVGVISLAFAVAAWTRGGASAAGAVVGITSSTPTGARSGGLPKSSLLTEEETFSSLLAQVHGRGKESVELQALVNEQAALVVHKAGKCDGSSGACSQMAKLRDGVLGVGMQRTVKRRSAPGASGRVLPRWLVGLELPEIAIEDDARVQRSLEYYAERPVGRELFQGMLFRCGAYRETIESALVRHGLPKDLLAVTLAESGCEPEVVSPVGAAGLWQLMPDTARAYGLRVTKGLVDERRNVPKSTEAAVRFLRDLRDKMAAYNPKQVWDLVLGCYNLGPFAMAARLEHAGADVSFWDLVDAQRLPDETVNYTPTVQALAIVLRNLQHFNFAGVQMRAPQWTSELEVPAGTRLSLIARAASTSLERIRALNLDILGDRTPDVPGFVVQVPKEVVWQARDSLTALIASHDESDQCVSAGFDWGRKHFGKEMVESCQRRLKSKRNDPATKD